MENKTGTLFIIATPIGNLEDITQRALSILNTVDLIAAEDTRHSGLLLNHYGIKNKLFALHDHNEKYKADILISKLQQGENIGLISDAGTPLISDPGFYIVRKCRQLDINVVPIPGPCAAIAALSASGIASDKFMFEGFLPAKQTARLEKLTSLANQHYTMIFYESTHRILATLMDIESAFGGDRYLVIAREMTKTWETIKGDHVANLRIWLHADAKRIKGEIVLIVEGEKQVTEQIISSKAIQALRLLNEELPLKKAAAIVAQLYGYKKNSLYQYGLEHFD